jgi:acyl carrier protein
MKSSIILYSAVAALTANHLPLQTGAGVLFVRSEEKFGLGVGDALNVAEKMEGKIVLNTVPHPLEERIAEIFRKLQVILAEQLGIDESAVTLDAKIYGTGRDGSLGADSLDTVELVMATENEFGLAIPDEDAEQLTTVRKALAYVVDQVIAEEERKRQAA